MSKPVKIEIKNLHKIRKAMRTVDKEFRKEMKPVNMSAATIVARQAKKEAPKRSGRLAKATTARASQNSAAVKAGTKARVPYAPPVHWGWKKRGIDPNEFIYRAIVKKRRDVLKTYNNGLGDLMKRAGIKRRKL